MENKSTLGNASRILLFGFSFFLYFKVNVIRPKTHWGYIIERRVRERERERERLRERIRGREVIRITLGKKAEDAWKLPGQHSLNKNKGKRKTALKN